MVSGCVFNVSVESFDGVQVCSFLMGKYYLHYVVDGAKGVSIVLEVLCKIGSTAVEVKGTHVFFVASVELPADPAHIGLLAIWAG